MVFHCIKSSTCKEGKKRGGKRKENGVRFIQGLLVVYIEIRSFLHMSLSNYSTLLA